MQRAMNLDLTHKLLLRTGLGEGRLGDDFGRWDPLVFQVCEFEAASEATFTKEFALEVLLDADLAIVLDDFLFDDGLGAIDTFFWVTLLHFAWIELFFE